MFTLVTDRTKYFRVKRGQNRKEVETQLSIPVNGEVFGGRIIETGEKMQIYVAKPFDSYRTVAAKTGIAEEELKKINFFRPVYPLSRLFVPCKK